jgi:hypothetical protein
MNGAIENRWFMMDSILNRAIVIPNTNQAMHLEGLFVPDRLNIAISTKKRIK